MRNLCLQSEQWRSLSVESVAAGEASPSRSDAIHLSDFCDLEGGSHFVALTNTGVAVKVQRATGELEWTANLNQVCTTADATNSWFDVTLIDNAQLVALSRHTGAITTIDPRTGECSLVGEFENGIHAAAWSPDKEILALVTLTDADADPDRDGAAPPAASSVLLSMNAQFEVLEEVSIENHTTDAEVSLCWRPDSTLVAVSAVDLVDQLRKVRIYKRETLALHAVGRTEDGSGKLVPNLQPPLAWAGTDCSGILASVQRKGASAQQVVFFEPNGLRHREFLFREEADQEFSVMSLAWNSLSDLLAIVIRCRNVDKVQLWHRSNYHWYLKKEFLYNNRKVSGAQFLSNQLYRLVILFESALSFVECTLRWDASATDHCCPNGTVYAIDGRKLHKTSLGKALVPPPMYTATLHFESVISQLVMPRKLNGAALAILSNGSVAVIGNDPDNQMGAPVLLGLTQPTSELQSLRHFCITEDAAPSSIAVIAAAATTDFRSLETIVELEIDMKRHDTLELRIKDKFPVEGKVLTIVPWIDNELGALVELEDGQLLEFLTNADDTGGSYLTPSSAEPLMEPCPWVVGLHDASQYSQKENCSIKSIVVGMSPKHRLYCNELMLCDAVSSFSLSVEHQFLCYASSGSQCQIRFLALEELRHFDPLMGLDENSILLGFEPRNIERGARLVALPANKPMAVLQMPRGNLEGIYPRALVLRSIIRLVNNRSFGAAFTMMRTHKVDLNLIIDLNPYRFLKDGGAVKFLEQVDNIDHLNLFISSLSDYDSTRVRYSIPDWFYVPMHERSVFSFNNNEKSNECCRCLRNLMIEMGNNGSVSKGHYLLPILSTFAKEDPPKLSDALELIREITLSNKTVSANKPALFSDSAQSAIQYLAFLADYELLFNAALGMYDFDMARAVARNSQMDPKTYLPLIKRYRELPYHYARYEVDMRLKRFEEALRNLFRSGAHAESLDRAKEKDVIDVPDVGNGFENCLKLIEGHHLYRLGLELLHEIDQSGVDDEVKNPVVSTSKILRSLGDYLLTQNSPCAALSVYLNMVPTDYERCKNAAKLGRDWRTFFQILSQQFPEDNENNSQRQVVLAHEIADELAAYSGSSVERRELLAEAAMIALQYEQDTSRAVDFLLQGELWNEAQRVARLQGCVNLVPRCVEAAAGFAESTIIDLEEKGEGFCSTLSRYTEALKIRKETAHADGEPVEGQHETVEETGSLFSAASNASNMSLQSTGSTGSIGSLSSVISVKSTTSFSITGGDEMHRHKSKYNARGEGGRKRDRGKKKKKTGRAKLRPGSEQELEGLVQTLRQHCIDEKYQQAIEDTIIYLFREGEQSVASRLFEGYVSFAAKVKAAQQVRLQDAAEATLREEKQRQREGRPYMEQGSHASESEVGAMSCPDMSESVHLLFSYVPLLTDNPSPNHS